MVHCTGYCSLHELYETDFAASPCYSLPHLTGRLEAVHTRHFSHWRKYSRRNLEGGSISLACKHLGCFPCLVTCFESSWSLPWQVPDCLKYIKTSTGHLQAFLLAHASSSPCCSPLSLTSGSVCPWDESSPSDACGKRRTWLHVG